MAMSLDTGGVAFTPAVPNDDSQAVALAGLKPISFQPVASPLQLQPLAGWSMPSSHPEYVSQGISAGLSAIGQGITAAFTAKKSKDREDKLLKDKYAHDIEVAKIRKGVGGAGGSSYIDDQGNASIPAGATQQNENGEFTDDQGNVITPEQAGQMSDPNGITSDQVSEVRDRMKASMPDSEFQKIKNKFQPNFLQDETFKYKPEFGAKKSNIQVAPKALGSTAPISEDNYVSAVRNPIPDIKAGWDYISDKATRFGNLENASRMQYVADTQAGRTPQNAGVFSNIKAVFSKPPPSYADKIMVDENNPQNVSKAPYQWDESKFSDLRNSVSQPITNIAPYASASTQGGAAGMQQLPVRSAAPEPTPNPFYSGPFEFAPAPQQGQTFENEIPVTANPPEEGKPQTYNLGHAGTPEGVHEIQAQGIMQDRPKTGPYRTIEAAQKEANRHYAGFEPNGEVTWSRLDHGYIVKRPPIKQYRLAQIQKADMTGLAYQNEQYNKDQDVTKIRSQHRLLNGFLSAYQSGDQNPATRNISDLDLIDNYIAFARGAGSVTGGGVAVTENQYNEIKKSKSVPLSLQAGIERVFNGEMLTKPERDTMLKTMLEAYNNQARIVNQGTKQMRESLKYTNRNLPEALMPHEFPLLRSQTEIEHDKNKSAKLADKLEAEIEKLPEGSQLRLEKMSEYQNLIQNLKQLGREHSMVTKNGGIPLNLSDLEEQSLEKSAGWRQGLFPKGAITGGGDADESGSTGGQ